MGCAADEPGAGTQPVYGGSIDGGDPNVPMLFYFAPDDPRHVSGFICSGSVVGKRTILTAAHCVKDNVDAGKQADGFAYFGTGDWRTDTANQIKFAGARYHRQYVPPAGGGVGTSDVAVVYLAADAPADPVVLNEEPLELLLTPTTKLRVVGWGDVATSGAGTKRTANVVYGGVTSYDTFYVGDQNAGICFGDSGGPTFVKIGTVERQVGIASYGASVCNGASNVARVDLYVKSFVYPAVDAFEGPCKVDGVCVTTGCRTEDSDCRGCGWDLAGKCFPMCEVPDPDCPIGGANGARCDTKYDCETRICTAATDDPRLKFCSHACVPAQPNCLPEQVCQAVNGQNLCVFKTPSPGAQGSPCSSGATCRSGLCQPAEHICVEQCDPASPSSCPTGYECQQSSLAPHVCDTPSAGGGCGVAGGDGSMALVWLLAVVALARRRPARDARRSRS